MKTDSQDMNPNGVETSGSSTGEWLQMQGPFNVQIWRQWYTWSKEVKTVVWVTNRRVPNDERVAEVASQIDVVDGVPSHIEIWTAVEWVDWGELGRIREIKCGRPIVLQQEGGLWGFIMAEVQMESAEPGVVIHSHE